jgi:hypothetical protein
MNAAGELVLFEVPELRLGIASHVCLHRDDPFSRLLPTHTMVVDCYAMASHHKADSCNT